MCRSRRPRQPEQVFLSGPGALMIPTAFLSLLVAASCWASRLPEARVLAGLSAGLAITLLWALTGSRAGDGRRGGRDAFVAVFDLRWFIPLGLLACFLAVQAWNASHVPHGADHGLIPRHHLPFLPRSADRAATLASLWMLGCCAALFVAVRLSVVTRKRMRVFVGLLAVAGMAMAVQAGLDRLTPRPFPVFPATGPFVNENTFAACINLLITPTLALGRSWQLDAARRGAGSHPGVLAYLAAAVMAGSLLLIRSRAGLLIGAILAAAWFLGEREALGGWRRRTAVVLAGAGCLLAMASAAGLPALQDWLHGRWPAELGYRAEVLRATVRMWSERWVSGTGAGTFPAVFPYYQPPGLSGFVRYAHNDWLQMLAEFGVAGSALLAWLGWGILRPLRTAAPEGGGGTRRRFTLAACETRGLALALAGLGLHAAVDFPMRTPGLILIAFAWAALLGYRATPAGGRMEDGCE